MSTDEPVLLEVEDVDVEFGGVRAVDDVSFEVRRGQVVSVIGPNGAGKSTLLNTISGVYRPRRGRVRFDGRTISRLKPHRIARLGMSRTFQNIALFPGMTVLDNIMLGRHVKMRSNVFTSAFYWGRAQRDEVRQRQVAEEIIDFLEIPGIRRAPVGELPYGLQKRVELGRALALEPTLLLLDEPMTGMNVDEKEDMVRFILDANAEKGITIVLIEHDMGVVMDISDHVVVLDHGRKISEGSPDLVREDRVVITAYLGESLTTRG